MDKYKKIEKEQEMKINLLKTTINTLQKDIKEKAKYISEINVEKISTDTDQLQIQTNNINEINNKNKIIEQLKNDLLISTENHNTASELLSQAIQDKNLTNDKYIEIKKRYQLLELNLQQSNDTNQSNTSKISVLNNELELKETLKLNLETELNLLRKEYSNIKTNNLQLQQSLQNKDAHIKTLTIKLDEKTKYEKIQHLRYNNNNNNNNNNSQKINSDQTKNSEPESDHQMSQPSDQIKIPNQSEKGIQKTTRAVIGAPRGVKLRR